MPIVLDDLATAGRTRSDSDEHARGRARRGAPIHVRVRAASAPRARCNGALSCEFTHNSDDQSGAALVVSLIWERASARRRDVGFLIM